MTLKWRAYVRPAVQYALLAVCCCTAIFKATPHNESALVQLCGVAIGIWNNLNANEQETVMSMLRGLRE